LVQEDLAWCFWLLLLLETRQQQTMLRCSASSSTAALRQGARLMVPTKPAAAAAIPRRAAAPLRPLSRCTVAVRALFGKGAAAKKAAAAASATILLPPDAAFAAATFGVVALYTLAVVAPFSKPSKAIFLDRPFLVPSLLGACYLVLAWQAHQTGALAALFDAARAALPAPEPAALAAVFKDRALTAMAWLHLLAVDLVSAAAVMRDGLATATPVRHSVALCLMFGPLGLLSHSITRAVVAAMRKGGGAAGGDGPRRSPSPLV
jgi:hypothetical protein